MEIERKFLIDAFPNALPLLRTAAMRQGYLSVNPVVRIRSEHIRETDGGETQRYVLCIKGAGTLAREEIEVELPEEKYRALEGLLPMPPVRKEFRAYALPEGLELECSHVDEGEPTAFFYAEVEFDSVDQARAFEAPAFLGREVTEERQYGMGSYWSRRLAEYLR